MADPPLPDLILYGRPDCGLCDEARTLIQALLADCRARNRPTPNLVERDIDSDPAWQRANFATIPVVELGGRRLQTVTSLAALRCFLDEVLDREPSTA
jgi:glutaredoxin